MAKREKFCKPFYDDCEYQSVPNVLHMLKAAMEDECESIKFCSYMTSMCQCEADKDLFKQIRRDDKKHYSWLQEIYRDLTCECYCVEYVNVKHPKGFCKGIKKAICQKMEAVKTYDQLVLCMHDVQHKEVICCIINEEKQHAQALASLYKLAQDCAAKKKCGMMPNLNICMPCGDVEDFCE